MNEVDLIYIVLPLLIIIQSIIGVGILVIGTPFMLLVNYDIISILSLLLPVSLITSFLNILLAITNPILSFENTIDILHILFRFNQILFF